ncbi:MAG: response regulator [Bacteroidales bacterium]|nr:response regulator [Bacteroidales bacterium]
MEAKRNIQEDKLSRILIVEDSPTQAAQLRYLFEQKDYEVVIAVNGKDGLLKAQEYLPDLIISDIIMPVMGGYEFCEKLKQNDIVKHIPVILLTALSDPGDIIKGLQAGADNFLSKPYTPNVLLSRVETILINKKLRTVAIPKVGTDVYYGGKKYNFSTDNLRLTDLLLSTYEEAVNKNNELIEANNELSRLKEDLEGKNNKLTDLNEAKNQFIGIAAHDLRNPLSTILSFGELLIEDLAGEIRDEQYNFITHMVRSAEFMLSMVNDLLEISEIESGRLSVHFADFDFSELVNMTIINNRVLASKKDINLIYNGAVNGIFLKGDSNKLEQVMNNFLSNAIKYSHSHTHINAELAVDGKFVEFSVKDQGVGIPEHELDNIFKPFMKGVNQPTHGEKSTGLGLMICKHIIEGHKGELGVSSSPGEGSTFFFRIPVVSDHIESNQIIEKQIPTDEIEWKSLQVLIVDDLLSNYKYLNSVLQRKGVNSVWLQSGQEAIDYTIANPDIDLILMDINMPGLDGFKATRKIREVNQNVVIIAQTAYAMFGEEEKSIEAGCDSYLSMPIRPANLINEIGQVFNRKRNKL